MKYQIGQKVTVMGHTATILEIDAKKKKYKVQLPNFIMEVSESIVNP
jgi:dsDNA-specific endonuclease/ATPase MutS2